MYCSYLESLVCKCQLRYPKIGHFYVRSVPNSISTGAAVQTPPTPFPRHSSCEMGEAKRRYVYRIF